MMGLRQTPKEKKHWVSAAYQTLGFKSSSHFGLTKKITPLMAPSNVAVLTKRISITT